MPPALDDIGLPKKSSFATGFANILTAAGRALPPTSLVSGGATGLDAPIAGFLRGFAQVQGQQQQQQKMLHDAEVSRARGEFQQSQTLLNLAKIGEKGAIGRGILESFFGVNIPAPLAAAFKEQQGMDLSEATGNESVVQTFIGSLASRGMLGDTPEENSQMVQHLRGIMRSLKPNQAATFGRLFHEGVVSGDTAFGMQSLSPFLELAIEGRTDDMGRQEREVRSQMRTVNRRTAASLMMPFEKEGFPEIANRSIVSLTDTDIQAMVGRVSIETIRGLRQSKTAGKREMQGLRKQLALTGIHRMTVRQPDWLPTVEAFDAAFHSDDLTEGVAAALLREVKIEGEIDMGDIGAVIGEMQAKARDRFWDDLDERHALDVIELDPTLAHLVADEPKTALDVPGIGLLSPDQIDQIARDMGKTPTQVRQMFIDRGAETAP